MIPKKIHYIWLGGKKKSKLAEACLLSWRLNNPDFEIIEWNEHNLDLGKISKENEFFNECYKRNLWAFMADYLRIKILYENGGIYIDTDVQSVKNISPLLNRDIILSYENDFNIGTGIIGADKENVIIKKILNFYNNEIMNSELYVIPNIFKYVIDKYSEEERTIDILPMEYLAPYNYKHEFNYDLITENTYTVHWFDGSWTANKQIAIFLQTKHIKNKFVKKIIQFKKLLGFYKRSMIRKDRK